MSEPWMDDLDDKRIARRGCSRRAKILLVSLIILSILVCTIGRAVVEQRRHEIQVQQSEIETRSIMPPNRPVQVGPTRSPRSD
jgi:hypothetical protein